MRAISAMTSLREQARRRAHADDRSGLQGAHRAEEIGHWCVVMGVRLLVRRELAAALHDESLRIDHPATSARGLRRQSVVDHRRAQQVRDAGGSFTGAEAQDRLVRHAFAGDPQSGEHSSDSHGGGSLYIVVEAAHLLPIAAQQPERIVIGEVLELHDDTGKHVLRGGDEFLEEFVVRRARQPLLAQTEVQRIGEQRRIVGTDVEHDRQATKRMQSGAGRVQRKLADRNAHAVRAEVAEAENALTIGHHDHRRFAMRPVAHHLRDAAAVARADEEARVDDDRCVRTAGRRGRRSVCR